MANSAHAYLVESIPKGLEDLRGTPGVAYTEDVLVRLTSNAKSSIDLTAMYWALLADPGSDDEKGFTPEQLDEMGAGAGRALYEALRAAAQRGVHIRILQGPGFSSHRQESDALQADFPDRISIHSVEMGKWYGGGGIMHQKVWIFDQRHLYLGSANMDWKSITQVKEMGVVVEDCPDLAADAGRYFEAWWAFAALSPTSVQVFDPVARINRRVPPWSLLVPPERRTQSPLAGGTSATACSWKVPLSLELGGEQGTVFLTVMDFAPVGIFDRKSAAATAGSGGAIPYDTPVWWSSLFDALLSAVLTRKVYVRLLVSKWAHTSSLIAPFLVALQKAADAGRAGHNMTAGQLEIKQFIIPGWDSTSGSVRKYPGHTRVNHTKYIVTDRRINIGTSNMTWDYFASTAGSSFNADHPTLVRTLQSVFDRDWASSYAWRLT